MNLSHWMIKWKTILLIVLGFLYIECGHHDMWHFYKMKKFMTMVAFARALGKRPTILPVPIPIPIPIAQNEIIKLPLSNGDKTMVIGAGGTGAKQTGISQILGTGSTTYGYSQPSNNLGNINLQSLTGSDSNVVSLSSLLGNNANNNAPKIIVIGGGSNMGTAPRAPLYQAPVMHVNGLGDLQNNNLGLYGGLGNNFVNNLPDLDGAHSNRFPGLYKFPPNLYSDFPRKRLPIMFGGRRNNVLDLEYLQGSGINHYPTRPENLNKNFDTFVKNNGHHRNIVHNTTNQRKPIPIGEKFDPIP